MKQIFTSVTSKLAIEYPHITLLTVTPLLDSTINANVHLANFVFYI
jgi:hypothetical protein